MSWYLLAFRKCFDFSGRARRREYWYFTLFYALSVVITTVLDMALGTFNPRASLGWLTALYLLVSLLPMLAVSVRRLHDIGRSGWWVLLNLVPGFGSLALGVIALFDSQPGGNAFGPSPKTELDVFEVLEITDSPSGKRQGKGMRVRNERTVVPVVVFALLVLGGCWVWWHNNSAEFLANGKAHREEGMAIGRTLDESACTALAVGALRAEASQSIAAGIATAVEFSGCLEASRAVPGFCDGTPKSTEILASAKWIADVCTQIGFGANTSCTTMLQRIPEYCTSEQRSKKLETRALGKT